MSKWKLITNVSFADCGGVRAWCHALLIDMKGRDGFFNEEIRQIRGLTYGGLPVFTIWIDPKSEIEFFDSSGSAVLLSHDGKAYDLGGIVVRAKGRDGKQVDIGLGIDNFRGKMVIEDIDQECAPFGDEIDERILPHAGGQAYPAAVWTMIPESMKKVKV